MLDCGHCHIQQRFDVAFRSAITHTAAFYRYTSTDDGSGAD
jgi:hypothetical protein